MDIILYSDDINLLSYWENTLEEKYLVVDELQELTNSLGNIIIINYCAINKNEREMLSLFNKNENLVLVLHRTPDIQVARKILALGAKGYGNALMQEHFILSAIKTMKEGMIWLHPEFTSLLINQIPIQEERDVLFVLDKLSEREKEVALLLKDGDTYKSVAQKLDITPRTVKAHAQSIYTKLFIKDRLALALLLK
ncbi:response regulator transcription factor [Sulfurimonas sp.]|uniref:response regulator transcription factor n=1 Tax=Sulfurimonas sp. TaxID=2022749 RepID=UPI002B4624B6|nr:LuxR C-terminal-related transcriptional regulator [Sulfurimonas sp.]